MERVDWWNRDTKPTKCGLMFHIVIAGALLSAICVYTAVVMSSDRRLSDGDIIAISVPVTVSVLWIVLAIVWYRNYKTFGNVTAVVVSCIKVNRKRMLEGDDVEAQNLQTVPIKAPEAKSKDVASEPMMPSLVPDVGAMPQTKI